MMIIKSPTLKLCLGAPNFWRLFPISEPKNTKDRTIYTVTVAFTKSCILSTILGSLRSSILKWASARGVSVIC